MSDRPIIFSGPMVRALLDGRKTQTRRVLKLPTNGIYEHPMMDGWVPSTVGGKGVYLDPLMTEPAPERVCIWHQTTGTTIVAPYAPGDRLYVMETHALVTSSAYRMSEGVAQSVNPEDAGRACVYHEGFNRCNGGFRWRLPILMPRWASRLTLIVTDVRVQRLQEISEEDAMAEGVAPLMTESGFSPSGMPFSKWSWRDGFRALWNSLHGPEAWDANPWVAAVSFTVKRANIDNLTKGGA